MFYTVLVGISMLHHESILKRFPSISIIWVSYDYIVECIRYQYGWLDVIRLCVRGCCKERLGRNARLEKRGTISLYRSSLVHSFLIELLYVVEDLEKPLPRFLESRLIHFRLNILDFESVVFLDIHNQYWILKLIQRLKLSLCSLSSVWILQSKYCWQCLFAYNLIDV